MRNEFDSIALISRPPCRKDCPDRKMHCHSTCEKYAEWKANAEKLRAEKYREKEGTRQALDYNKTTKNRLMKRMGKW